ncbi:MAG: helicase-related protein [Bacteroidaceae bacterium]|nr:helicase-related protein [Bacteroidaceae bacterium]
MKPLGDTQLGEQPTAGYSIEPTTYTNKKGKTTPMHLVTFGRELSKDEIRAGKELAKESRGWWDRDKGGFMMRDEDSAKALAEALSNEEAVQDAQPLSVEDVATATDQADMKAASESIKVEQEPQTTPQYDYEREDDVYDKTLTGLRNVLNDRKRGAIPNIKSIENIIRDLRKRAKTIEDGMATAAGETIPQAFDALANLNGRRKAYEQFLVDIRKKMAETERDDALAAHGVKLGDKIMYKGKEVTIHDADARQVTLDVGLAPVMYEVTDWENVELPKPVKEYHGGDRVFSVKHNANKDIFVAHHKDGTVEYTFTDGTKANADEVQDALPMEQETQQTPFKTEQEAKDYLVSIGYDPDGLYMNNPKNEAQDYIDEANYQKEKRSEQPKEAPKNEQAQPKQEEKKAKSKWVDDADAERFEELRRRLRMKLGGQLNMGLDPEAFAIGVEMSYLMLKHGARKFGEFAKNLIEALGEGIRPYVKTLYNGARDLPEMADIEKDMTPWDEVRSFDVMNFDKEGAKDIVATAEHIVREQAAEREAKEATNKLKQERNEQRKEIEQQVAAENSGNQQENPSKERKSKKKSVSLREQTIPDLFSGLFSEDLKPTSNEQEVHVQPRTGTSERERGHQREQNEPLGKSEQNEDERPDTGRVAGRSGNDTKSDTAGGSRVSEPSDGKRNVKPAKPEPAPLAESERKNTHNNHAERGTDYAPKGTSARIEANIKAIETMQRLIESGEPATPEDMSVLRKFSGWGGLGAAFKEKVSSGDSGYNPRLRDDYQPANPINARLRDLLSPEAYEAANMSRNSAYYTPAPVIDAMWDVVRAMGFRGGNVLEGSAGIGNIIGLMPTDMSERSNIHAVEIDETTGNILSLLYPDANVEVKGFEKTFVPNGSVDLAITNVPFVTGLRVMDETGDKDLSRKFHDIHDFCIAKNVRKLKEGGVGIFITSSGTLDSPNSAKLRTWLVNEGGADVVGAFRMHKDTFGGAGVTSDIIVIRKRVNGRKSANAIDVSGTLPIRTVKYNTGETKRGSSEVVIKDLALDVNKHFVEHPEDMAGEMAFAFEKGDTYRATSKALYPSPSINQEQRLSEWAQQFKDMDWDKAEERESQQVVYEDLGEDVKEGSMLLDSDGNLCLAQRGKAVPINVNANKVKGHTKAECFNAYKAIKDALADVLEYQTTHSDDSGLQQRLAKLNKAYDSFVKTYGHLNKNTSISFLRSDMDYPSIAALESVSETGDKSGKRIVTYGKTDIFSRRVVETGSEPKPTTIKDGIIASIYLNGRVDVPYIAEQLNMSDSDVRQQIIESGLGFENPTTTEMEVSYEYLSGNVREKLRQAQENNTDGRYDANIKALERVIPMNIPAHLIEFTLGSSWVEPKLYEDFVKERTGLDVKLTNAGGTWIMSEPYYTNTEQNKAMGVISEKCDKTILGHELIKAAITCKSISVTKTISTGFGSSKTTETIVDKEATMACANKIDEIRQDFKDWARGKMQGDPEMSERMERVYNELFNNSVPKEIPDDFVPEHFGDAATVVNGKPFKLRPHQAKAVIRATTQPLMLAHEVGTGKTYTLISTAMEMRRLGTARKPMIVVQNATVGQFVASAKALYPNAKILTLEDADRNAEGRRNFYAKIRYNDWDMIVVPQSVFEMIPDSEERQIRFVEDKVEEKMMVLEKMREAANDDRDPVLRQAQRELDQLNDELNDLKLALQERKAGGKTEKDEKREAKTRQNAMVKAQEMLDRETDDVANFDDMGIDALLIDEAHEYKHLGFATAMQRGVKGVDPSYSKKSQGVYLKSQAVLESKNGKNVVFATGTPISNTAAEIWTFMRYLMPADTMREYGIYYFDDFVRNFGNIQQMLEFATNGKYKENNRFAGYVNLPELVRIWAGVADTVLTREAGGVSDKIPKMEGEKAQDIYLPQTKALRGVMKFVKDQLDDYEKMSGKEKKENSHIPLTMYGIAKASAVDARLVLEDAADDPNSKTNEAVRQTLRSLEDTKEYNGTVAIFADNYQNKATGFNLYEDIRKKLIDAGVPEAQVVVMKSGMSIKKKLEIFDKVNRGEVRVIMGSTFTLGTGVNIQERLHTLIHVDAPNRPMDYTQRNGRILRQGNLHNEWGIPVRVLRFGVEDSLDVTAYQRLKTKGAIADSIMEGKKMMSNSMENRVLEEEQDLFGDITAQLSGSQYALLKNQVEKEVKKLEARRKQWEADQTYVHNQKPRLKALIKDSEERAKRNKEALAKVEAAKNDGITIGKMKFPSLDAMGDYIKDYNSKQREQQEQVRIASGYKAEAKSDLTVSVGGFDFHVHRVISKEQKQEKGQLSLSFFSKTQMTYSCPELGLEDVPVDGQRLKSALEDILENVLSGDDFREKAEYAERAAERYKGELQQVEARDGKPFEYADELKQAKEKLAEYEELMKAEMAEKEAKYAEMDASVEAAKGVQLSDEDSDDAEPFAEYKGVKQMKSHDGVAEEVGERERMVVEAMAEHLRAMGIETITDIEEAQRVLDEANGGASLSAKKRRALETVSVSQEEKHQPTVVSSADGAKILKELDTTKEKYENQSNRANTFLGDVSKALGAHRHGSASEYATFETKNGRLVTIRLSNHNAKVSTFDNHGEEEGISIVVSPKKSGGMANDGNAHVVEYYYDAIKLRRADGKPLAAIVRSIRQALYSGEYKDTTGLAEVQEVNGRDMDDALGGRPWYFRTGSGVAYGFTLGGKIYIDPRIATSETPVHEYVHLWSEALGRANPEAWTHLKAELANDEELVSFVRSLYPELTDENALMHEVFSHFAGRRGRARLDAERAFAFKRADGLFDKARIVTMFERLKSLLSRYWQLARDLFAGNNAKLEEMSAEDFADMAMADFMHGFNPVADVVSDVLESGYARSGDGAYNDADLSLMHDPLSKMLGRENRGEKQRREFAERERKRMAAWAGRVAGLLHLDNVEIVTDASTLDGKKRNAKGFYSKSTGKITIVIPNHSSTFDVEQTLLHEAVAHYGLRRLFGEHFDTFLDNVFSSAEADVRRRIVELASRNGWDFRTATEEYLASLAEHTNFEDMNADWWMKLKSLFSTMLRKLGFEGFNEVSLSDNEFRYILWRSYQNLKEPGRFKSIFSEAEDIVKQRELGVGQYAVSGGSQAEVAEQEAFDGIGGESIEAVNARFNDALSGLTEANADSKIFSLGSPSPVLLSAGVEDKPMKLYGNKVVKKMKKHGFSLAELEDLPRAVADPIAVFNNYERVGNRSILTELNTTNGNFLVTIDMGKGGEDVDFNIVSSVFGKDGGNVVDWIERGLATYINKEKALRYLHHSALSAEALSSPKLSAATKIVKEFENPSVLGGKVSGEDVLFREGDANGIWDIWKNQSLGLQERITAAATRLANNHRDNKTLRNDAMRAIGGNLSDLRKAMSLQRTFDMTTVKRVADLARVLMDSGYLSELSQQEVKRLLSAVKNSVGHNDIEGDVQKVMDIMVDYQLKRGEDTLQELEVIKGSKVDARGVEVQGQLDPAGQHVMKVFKKTRGWEVSDIDDAISESQQRMAVTDRAIAEEASLDYIGLQLAREYVEEIRLSKTDEHRLREEIRQAHEDASERDRATDSYRQYIASLQEAVRQNKIERAQAYFNLVARISNSLRESIANAQAFKEAEKQRIREIQYNANSDMEGRPSDEHYRPEFMDNVANNPFVSFFLSPLASFDQMLRLFGSKSANGEGYLYNRFMRGWVDARQQEISGVYERYATLDSKAAELFGGKVNTWGDLILQAGRLPKGVVSFLNGGEMREHELTQGNLMYIYMVNKMLDGRMKLRKMGITEEDVDNIEQILDPRLLQLADWLQDEFLVSTRNTYNETHKRMFGASMAAIENYFPLKILANARADKPEDLDAPDKGDGISTATGSIIKRRRNSLALDITGADALHVILEHVAQMEHWNAFASFNRDLNTLRTYKRFRNQVQNMTTVYGSGKVLWKKFNDVCQMASGSYRPPRAKFDEMALNFAKGVSTAKVNFRIFTALKQFLSIPAYIPDSRIDYLLADLKNPVGAWNWSMEHLPIFKERWKSRMSGDPRLLKADADWGMWRSRAAQFASRVGMSPNAFVDAVTVSIGAHAMYRTRKGQYLRDGYSDEIAERRAVQDAEILYNQTQQSSEGAFLSTMQVDRSWLSVLFTVFRNSSMAYQRQLHDSLRNLKRNLNPVNYGSTISFMKKQYVRDGIDEAQAEQNAKRKFRRQMLKDTLRVVTFGYLIQFVWNLGSYVPYLLFGGDDDDKRKMLKDAAVHALFGFVEGFSGGDVLSQAGYMLLSDNVNPTYLSKEMALTSDLMDILYKLGNGKKLEALTDMINLIVQAGIGVNPQSITDALLAIMDVCGDDPALANESTIFVSRILQVPQSQIDKLYFDEVGLHGSEVSDYTPSELAARYARYKIRRGRFYTPWQWDDSEQLGKYADKANSIMKERLLGMGDEDVDASYVAFEEVYKGVDKQLKVANEMLKTDYLEAARMISEARNDRQSYPIYMTFKKADAGLDKLVQVYLSAKTQEEISLCEFTIPAYRSAMVDLLNATGTDREQDAMRSLQQLVDEFSDEYEKLRSKQNEDEADKRK